MSKSPFEDPSNPFQDPSITSALNSSNKIEEPQDNQDEFTSFHHVSDTHDPYSFQESSTNQDNFKTREEALLQKERELADRERELENRQRQTQGMKAANNFPPCFPIMHLDITTEIPLNHQQTVWWIYREWLLFEVTLVLNFIACLCVLFSHPASVQYGPANMGIALTEMFTHTLASFFLWYRPVYNAYMKENSLYYYFYFVFNGFHILYTFYMAIGVPSTGGAGLILLITLFTDRYIGSAVMTLLADICWFTMGFMALFLYKQTYDHYKAEGHTFNEAKSEAYSQMGKSTMVRDAAVNAMRR